MKSSQPPKLLLLSTAYSIGGMERIVCGLSREFSSRNWKVRTIFPKSNRDNVLLEWCREQCVPAETNSALLGAADKHTWKASSKLRDLIKISNPDVINIHYGDNFISLKDTIALRISGKQPVFVTVHHPTRWNSGNRKKRLMTFLSGIFVEKIITISNATYRVLRQSGIPSSKLTIIPNGVLLPSHEICRSQARNLLGLPKEKVVVGTLSRLVPHKGIIDLIKAINLVNGYQNVFLAVAGDGPEKETLEGLASIMLPGRCQFLGRIKDIDQFMSAIDIFVLPSYMEGFGLVFIEAAFHGVPSVGTKVGGVPDVIIPNMTGLLVQPGDYISLANAIDQLSANGTLRNELGAAARKRAVSEFTETIMADRYENMFHTSIYG
jgi:glycosyltransferase involved in cell wall biosynthesis